MGTKFGGAAGSPQFKEAFAPYGAKQGGFLGSGMGGEDVMNLLIRAAALAQGDYGGAAQIGQLIGAPKREAAKREQDFQDWKREFDYKAANSAPDLPPIVRDAEAWSRMTPEQRAALTQLEDVRNPVIRQGVDGLPYAYPRGGQLPQGYDPNEWEVIPDPTGGAAPTAPVPFDPARLDAVTAESESGNRDNVYSPKGAMHRMQVMPSTARDPGFGVAPARSNDPAEINRVGRDYRAAMQDRYGGDLAAMWGAYNWGPGNVDNALRQYGPDWLRYAPRETQNYIARNLGMLRNR